MKSGWKNRKSAPLLIDSFFNSKRATVGRHFLPDTCLVFFPVKFHSGLPDSTGTHRSRILEFLRRGVEVFLSCGPAFHGSILS